MGHGDGEEVGSGCRTPLSTAACNCESAYPSPTGPWSDVLCGKATQWAPSACWPRGCYGMALCTGSGSLEIQQEVFQARGALNSILARQVRVKSCPLEGCLHTCALPRLSPTYIFPLTMCAERRVSKLRTNISFSLLQMNAVYQFQCIWEEQASQAASRILTPCGYPLCLPCIRLVAALLLTWDFS